LLVFDYLTTASLLHLNCANSYGSRHKKYI